MATTLADPAVRNDLGEVLHGDFKGNWSALGRLGGDILGVVPGVGLAKGVAKGGDILAEGVRGFPKIVDIASTVAHDPGLIMKPIEKYVPKIGVGLEKIRLLEPGAAAIPGATADMLNFINKGMGAAKKTVSAVVDG